jgi:hypothetical protein
MANAGIAACCTVLNNGIGARWTALCNQVAATFGALYLMLAAASCGTLYAALAGHVTSCWWILVDITAGVMVVGLNIHLQLSKLPAIDMIYINAIICNAGMASRILHTDQAGRAPPP